MLVAGGIVLIGVLLLIVGLVFAFQKGVAWPTSAGYILFGLAVVSGGAAVSGGGKWAIYLAVTLGLAGAAVLIGHYLGFF
ncbi:MAG: hypothetical protein WCB19_05720 [Thermoplasmata archaeon]